MPLRTLKHPRITTKRPDGTPNGFLVPIYNFHEGFIPAERQPMQTYLTVAAVGEVKGPHLHNKRWGYFTCLKGNIRVVARVGDAYEEHYSGEDHGFATVEVPAGVPSAIQNIGTTEAYVLNTPFPAWQPHDQDDHPVVGWTYRFA